MSVQQIVQSLHGNYDATGAYSLEFVRDHRRIEVFLLLPPEEVEVSEPMKTTVAQTIGGTYITDYGNAPKPITISGECHFFHAGAPGVGKPLPGASVHGGFEEFIKLRFLFGRFRDYTMSPDGKLSAPMFEVSNMADVAAIKMEVARLIDDGIGATADKVDLYWHDYDYNDHFKVIVNEFSWRRSKDDPWTVFYTLDMTGIEVDPLRSGWVGFNEPVVTKRTTLEALQDVKNLINNEHAATRPSQYSVTKEGTEYIVSTEEALT